MTLNEFFTQVLIYRYERTISYTSINLCWYALGRPPKSVYSFESVKIVVNSVTLFTQNILCTVPSYPTRTASTSFVVTNLPIN